MPVAALLQLLTPVVNTFVKLYLELKADPRPSDETKATLDAIEASLDARVVAVLTGKLPGEA